MGPAVGLIDSGVGNPQSLLSAFRRVGCEVGNIHDISEIRQFTHIVLMGVGNFGYVSKNFDRKFGLAHLRDELSHLARPVLGICVGFQMLFESSEESPSSKGLGLLQGPVKRIPVGVPSPHVGWNNLEIMNPDSHILKGVDSSMNFYFTHSFVPFAKNPSLVDAIAVHGAPLAVVASMDNFVGVQFHPEKSQAAGERVLTNFLSLP